MPVARAPDSDDVAPAALEAGGKHAARTPAPPTRGDATFGADNALDSSHERRDRSRRNATRHAKLTAKYVGVIIDSRNAHPNANAVQRRRHIVGLLCILGAAMLWSTSGALIKMTYDGGRGLDGVTIAFFRSLIAGLFLIPLVRGRWRTLERQPTEGAGDAGVRADEDTRTTGPAPSNARSRRFGPFGALLRLRPAAIACVVFFALMTATFVLANTQTKAANVIILQYTSTFWVFILSPRIIGERPRPEDRWILIVAMIGIGVIFTGNMATGVVGLLVALTSGLFYALLMLMIRIMRDSDSAAVTVLNNLGSAALLLPIVLMVGHLPGETRHWVLLVVLGVFQFGLPYYLFTLGLARVPAYQAALVALVEPLLNPLWTYAAVRETVPTTTLIGGGIVLAALVLFVRAARRSALRVADTVG